MGTLYEQPEREYHNIGMVETDNFFKKVLELSKKYKLTNQDIITGLRVLELKRKNDLYVNNGNIHDEQMSGIGKELSKLYSSLDDVVQEINNKV